MGLFGGTFSGATPVSLATILGTTRTEFKQIDVKAAAAAGVIYVGGDTVSSTTAWVELAGGEAWGLNPGGFDAAGGPEFEIEPTEVFLVGTTSTDVAYVVALL